MRLHRSLMRPPLSVCPVDRRIDQGSDDCLLRQICCWHNTDQPGAESRYNHREHNPLERYCAVRTWRRDEQLDDRQFRRDRRRCGHGYRAGQQRHLCRQGHRHQHIGRPHHWGQYRRQHWRAGNAYQSGGWHHCRYAVGWRVFRQSGASDGGQQRCDHRRVWRRIHARWRRGGEQRRRNDLRRHLRGHVRKRHRHDHQCGRDQRCPPCRGDVLHQQHEQSPDRGTRRRVQRVRVRRDQPAVWRVRNDGAGLGGKRWAPGRLRWLDHEFRLVAVR